MIVLFMQQVEQERASPPPSLAEKHCASGGDASLDQVAAARAFQRFQRFHARLLMSRCARRRALRARRNKEQRGGLLHLRELYPKAKRELPEPVYGQKVSDSDN